MVHQIIKSKHRVFVESLILTLLILLIGFSIGFYVESSRANSIIQDYKDFEISVLDLKLQNYYYQIMDQSSCNSAIEQNLIFAEDIYSVGLNLQKYEDAGEILESSLFNEKRRYVLLKTELWLNSILLKKKCDDSFHTVVYLYTQYPSLIKDAEQDAISKILGSVKEDYGNDIVLIPIAADIGLDSVDMLMDIYEIDTLPTILIDEDVKLKGFKTKEEIEIYLN
jgi:hypothetical protein